MLIAVLALAMTGVAAVPAGAAPPSGEAVNQISYTVGEAFPGEPENLWQIAERFLGDGNRAGEILALNAGRIQRDGGRLTDPSRLHTGWELVLPWDAAGEGLHSGALTAYPSDSDCGQAVDGTQLTPPLSQAWEKSDGAGVTVALLGSGVDGAAAGLAGRVTPGADVVAGTGRGDTACEGSGTTLAGIVAGDRSGVAPQARIMPIRAGDDVITSDRAATAIAVAARSGAQVILVGADIDGADPGVRAAVGAAIARDAVVVVPATVRLEPADGLLSVGADGGDPPSDSSELLAPGAGPAAFVAGTVALVRSAHPELHAAEVTRQVRATAAGGVVNPDAAVTAPLPAGVGVNAPWKTSSGVLPALSGVLLGAGAFLAVVVVLGFVLYLLLGASLSRRRADRRAMAARARLTGDGDDPFWQPPGPARQG
ncbi:hypothetical protein GCM10010435_27120 [Winogradskya consettensis]|uniref:Peptidase S8/S53 domain-containing protein n=2 Tax=Winogradskya consettensis TaxID=113560 RepID=A0A919S9B5_9ACTN|nr:hypothetical protein Aco04nite_09910 [Actinoplanes consettensis]